MIELDETLYLPESGLQQSHLCFEEGLLGSQYQSNSGFGDNLTKQLSMRAFIVLNRQMVALFASNFGCITLNSIIAVRSNMCWP